MVWYGMVWYDMSCLALVWYGCQEMQGTSTLILAEEKNNLIKNANET
jgi:hypothetical protein